MIDNKKCKTIDLYSKSVHKNETKMFYSSGRGKSIAIVDILIHVFLHCLLKQLKRT